MINLKIQRRVFFLKEGKKLPNFCYIRFKQNKGLTRSWNYGVWFALKKLKADYIFFANNDIIIPKDSINKMVSGLKKIQNSAIIGPLTNCPGFHKKQDIRQFYPAYEDSERMTNIQKVADVIKNNKVLEWDELNGFFYGGGKEAFKKNLYARVLWSYYFDPNNRNIENEREFQKRFRKTDMKILLAANVFIFHYKDVSQQRGGSFYTFK